MITAASSAAVDQHCFRSRIESAKADLKKMFSVDVCQQMDVLFGEVLHDLELAYSLGSSGSSSHTSSSSSKEPPSYSEDSGAHMVTSSTSSSSSSAEHEDVLPSSSEKASSVEQPEPSDLPPAQPAPNDESALEECQVVSICSQEAEEKQESNEPASDLATLNRTLCKDDKHQQYKTLYVESNEVVCPIAWCNHVSFKRHQFIIHFEQAHPEVTTLNCVTCGTTMYRPWDMFMHELMYHLTGVFGCKFPGCTFVGGTRATVLAHYDIVHLDRSAPRRPRSIPPFLLYRPRYHQRSGDEVISSYMNNGDGSAGRTLAAVFTKKPKSWTRKAHFNPMKVEQWRSKSNGFSLPATTASTSYPSTSSAVCFFNQSTGRYEYQATSMPPAQINDGNSAFKLGYSCGDQYYRYQHLMANGGADVGEHQQQQQQQQQQQPMYTANQVMPSSLLPPPQAHHNFFL